MNWSLPVCAVFLCSGLITKDAQAGVPVSRNDLNPATYTLTETPAPKWKSDSRTHLPAPLHHFKKSAIPYPYTDVPEYTSRWHVKGIAFIKDGQYLNMGVRAFSETNDRAEYGGQYFTYDISRLSDPAEVNESGLMHGFNYDNQYSPDGRFLFSIDQNGQVRIDNVEDMKNPQHVSTLPWPGGQAKCLTVSQDGQFMVVGGEIDILTALKDGDSC